MTNSTIETIEVAGKEYKYLQYPDNKSSVNGLVITITPEVRENMLGVGGFYRDILEPLSKDDSIEEVVILTVTERGMKHLTGFFFPNGEKIKTSWVGEYNIAKHYADHLDKKNVPFEIINSLEYLKNNPKEEYLQILTDYEEPKTEDDTGIHLDGEVIPYGETVVIKDVQKMVEKYPNLAEGVMGKLNVDNIQLKINENGLGLFNIIGSGTLYQKDGTVITVEEGYFHTYYEKEENETFEEYEKQADIERIHYHAEKANQRLTRGYFSKERIMVECIEGIEKDRKEIQEPVGELIEISYLLAAIEMGLVTKGKTDKYGRKFLTGTVYTKKEYERGRIK